MGADDAIVALGTNFARIMLGGNVTVFMIFLINAVFRGAAMRCSPCARCGSRTR